MPPQTPGNPTGSFSAVVIRPAAPLANSLWRQPVEDTALLFSQSQEVLQSPELPLPPSSPGSLLLLPPLLPWPPSSAGAGAWEVGTRKAAGWKLILIKHRIIPSSPCAPRTALSPGITHMFGEKSFEASQSQRGTCRFGRIKIFSFFPPGWFLLLLSSLCLSLRQDFEEIDFLGPFSPSLKGTGLWGLLTDGQRPKAENCQGGEGGSGVGGAAPPVGGKRGGTLRMDSQSRGGQDPLAKKPLGKGQPFSAARTTGAQDSKSVTLQDLNVAGPFITSPLQVYICPHTGPRIESSLSLLTASTPVLAGIISLAHCRSTPSATPPPRTSLSHVIPHSPSSLQQPE